MKLAYFIPNLNEYSSKVLTTMLARFKAQTTDSDEQILQNLKRFEQLSGAIAQKFANKNPAVIRAIPSELHNNSRFRDVTQYQNYDDFVRVLKSVEKKEVDIYKQAIEYFKKRDQYQNPAIIGMYVGRFKQVLPQLKQAIADKNEDVIALLPKDLQNKEAENILNFRDLHDLEKLIDGAYPFTSDEKAELNSAETDADLVYKGNDGIEVYRGDAEHKCIKYGSNQYYGWCIARTKGSMYGNYRFMQSNGNNRLFYFVFDRTASDKKNGGSFENEYHAVVIHVNEKGLFTRTTASNNGDEPYGGCKWSEFVQYWKGEKGQKVWNKIKGLEKFFKFAQPSSEERIAHGFKGQRMTLDAFIDLPSNEKQAWLRINASDRDLVKGDIVRSLDNEQINDLINHNRLFSFDELSGNKPLLKRYADYRYTRFPKEALPYPFIPYLKPELQRKYFVEFEEEYLTYPYIEKYMGPEMVKEYIEQQINKFGYLPKEAMEKMDPKQRKLYEVYSIAQSQFKMSNAKLAAQNDVIGTVKAPQQDFVLNTPSAEYFSTLDQKHLSEFNQMVKTVKPKEKYVEFIWGVPTSFEYNDKLYYYTPKNQNDDELDSESEWVIINQEGNVIVKNLFNRSEEGVQFFKKGERYTHYLGSEDYLVGSNTIPLIEGVDFDQITIKTLDDKTQTFKSSQIGDILRERLDEYDIRKLQSRAGIR